MGLRAAAGHALAGTSRTWRDRPAPHPFPFADPTGTCGLMDTDGQRAAAGDPETCDCC